MNFQQFKKQANQIRAERKPQGILITKEQEEFIKLCRDHETPIPYAKMGELWEELGWGTRSTQFFLNKWRVLQLKDKKKKV